MPDKIQFTEAQLTEMVALYRSGASTTDLAKLFSVGTNTARARLIDAGVVFTKEACRERISAKLKGRPSPRKGTKVSAESRARMVEAHKHLNIKSTLGKVYTPEERARVSAGQRAYWAANPRPKNPRNPSPEAKRSAAVRSRCKNLLRRVLCLTGKKKATRTMQALGYTQEQFIARIESQFKPGMSWDSRESFHIDHIVPVSHFISKGITDPKVINALSNLQPLPPEENRAKGARYVEGLQ